MINNPARHNLDKQKNMEDKTNTELLKEIQDIVDEYNSKKEEVMVTLDIMDSLESKYHKLMEEVQEKRKK